MVGITSYGAYIPYLRLSRRAISERLKGEKALANFDEDSVTMAVASVIDCLRDVQRESVDGLFFASTTSPYKEKQAATIIAVATDLRRDIITADYANTLKAGTSALRSAADAVVAGTTDHVMVVAADTRTGTPGSVFEQNCGDGAAAILIGKDNVIASLEGSYSVCHEIMDVWRIDNSRYIRSPETKFTVSEGYQKAIIEAVSGVLKNTGLKTSDVSKLVFYTPDEKGSVSITSEFGFEPKTQLQDPLFNLIGNTGTPYAMMLLVAALEESKPGDIILMATYGNGADALVFKVTQKIKDLSPRRGMKYHLTSKQVIESYKTYLYYRNILPGMENIYPLPFGSISCQALCREVDKNLRLHGVKCDICGTVQYPPQRVCSKCHSKDKFQAVRFSDKKGKVFTFSMDYVSSIIDSPAGTAIIDFREGGKMQCFMTDWGGKEVKIGMDIEMTFRKLFQQEEIINYCWKAMPPRA